MTELNRKFKLKIKSGFLITTLIILTLLSLTGCKKEPTYESLKEELQVKMADRINNPLVMRIDDAVGASYMYIDDTISVIYQPSHKQKTITICQKINNSWVAKGYNMKVTEDKYSAYTPKTAIDSEALKEDYVNPFLEVEVLSENKEEKSMRIAVNFAREREEWTAFLNDKNFVKFVRDIVPTNIFIYDSKTQEYEIVLEAVTEEVEDADKNMGEILWKRLEKVTGKKKKKK